MSIHTDWTPLSKTYDVARPPASVEMYLGLAYTYTGKTAPELHVLDAGCGTGNHIKYLLDHGLGKATLLDADEGMLKQTREKLKSFTQENSAEIVQHTLPSLPFADSIFDMVTSNFVLHHLVNPRDGGFTLVQEAIDESFRVLKPKGLMLILLCTPHQFVHGHWLTQLIPEALQRAKNLFPSSEKMSAMFEKAGFKKNGQIIQPKELIIKPELYFKPDVLLNESFWKTNSVTASCKQDEKSRAQKTIKDLKEKGELEGYFKEADTQRSHIGQYSLYYAVKE